MLYVKGEWNWWSKFQVCIFWMMQVQNFTRCTTQTTIRWCWVVMLNSIKKMHEIVKLRRKEYMILSILYRWKITRDHDTYTRYNSTYFIDKYCISFFSRKVKWNSVEDREHPRALWWHEKVINFDFLCYHLIYSEPFKFSYIVIEIKWT